MRNKVYPWCGARNILINKYSTYANKGCDGKEHPKFEYRPYRRGFNRCKVCGGALSFMAKLVNTIYEEVPFLKMMSKKNEV